MPDAGYFGLTYELLFEGDSAWTDITALVDSRTTKIDIAGCSEELKSVINKCSFEMRYNTSPSKAVHSTIVGKILSAKQAGQTVKFRMGGIASFVGKVDLGSFSQRNGRIPGFLTVTVEDNSYLLDEAMPASFEYPENDDLDDDGYAVFDKANLAQSIVMLRLLDAGYTIDQIDMENSDSITEKVRRVVYDADDERTYRDFIDTLLYEHCAVLYTTPEGKLSVRRLYKESPTSERSLDHFLVNDGIETSGGDYQFDGVKVVWSNLSRLDGAVVYNANITMKLDDEGNREGEEIQPQHYWPEDGDIEETWQEFNATFLDREYQTKVSRIKNKDLSLISVKNAYYEVDKDAEILLANNPPEIRPTKARVLWWNSHSTDVKKLYGFTIVGDALFRSRLNDTTYPTDAKRLDDAYETEFVYTSEAAAKLANHLHRFRKYGDLQHKWAEIDVDTPMFQVVTVSAPDTLISSLGMVISQSITFPAPNKIKRSNSAIGITAFNSEPVKTRSIQLGGAPVNTGPAGENGMRFMVQYALGTQDAPYASVSTKVGTDLALVGTSVALLGTDNSGVWTTNIPTPALNEFVWRREGYYIAPATFPTTWEVTRLTGNKGDSAVHGELTNDSHTIPTDVNGDNGNYTGCTTTMHIYLGGVDDSDNWTYSASISAGITASLVGNTLTVTAMDTDTGYVDVTASRTGFSDITRRFSLSKSKQGAVGADATAYWLVSSVAAVKKTQASVYVPATVIFSSKSQTGDGSPAYYDGRFVISESIDGLAWTMKYTSASDEHTKEYTPSAGIVAIKCELYQTGGTVALLDEETVPIVLDGSDGATGASGLNLADAKMMYTDPTFRFGSNNMDIYNNSGDGTVTITREAKQSDSPFAESDYNIKILTNGTASPGLGGFHQLIQSRASAVFVQRIIAKIPVGYTIESASNSIGSGGTHTWLTSQAGTGTFQEYILIRKCGATGTFSTSGYIYLTGTAGTTSSPVVWYVAFATVYDMTAEGSAEVFDVTPESNQIRTSARGSLLDQVLLVTLDTLYNVNPVTSSPSAVLGSYSADQTKTASISGQNAVNKFYCVVRGTGITTTSIQITLDGQVMSLGDQSPEDDTELAGFINFSSKTTPTTLSVKALAEGVTVTEFYLTSSLVDWSLNSGQLIPLEHAQGTFDGKRYLLLCDTVTEDTTITAALGDLSATTSITLITTGDSSPQYLGASNSAPQSYNGEGLILGDFFLYTGDTDGTFTFGRIYEYNGTSWTISEKSDHLAMAAVDALNLAKATGDTVWAANAYIDTLTTARLIVHKYISSTNWDTDDDDVPISGFYLDGIRGVLRAYGLEAYSTTIYGWLESDGFRTIREQSGITISASTIPKTVFKWDDMIDCFPSYETSSWTATSNWGSTVSGTVEGFSFVQATRRNNQRVLFSTGGAQTVNVVAGNSYMLNDNSVDASTQLGKTFLCDFHIHYSGNFSSRAYMFMDDSTGEPWFGQHVNLNSGSYQLAFTSKTDTRQVVGTIFVASTAWWGAQPATSNYNRMWSGTIYNGLVVASKSSSSFIASSDAPNEGVLYLPYENDKYVSASIHPFSVGDTTQASITNYASGSDFYDKFVGTGKLQIGSKGYMTGTVSVTKVGGSAISYIINRLNGVTADSISFNTDKGTLTIDRFIDGTSVGVYSDLQIVETCLFSAVSAGVETKHIMPMGTDSYPTGNNLWTIGTQERKFAEAWITNVDADAVYTGGITAGDGCIEISAPTPYIDFHFNRSTSDYTSRIIESASGLLTVPASFSVGNALYYKPTTQFESDTSSSGYISKTISAMAVGEHKLFKWKHHNSDDSNSKGITIVCPSGGTYLVTLTYRVSTDNTDPPLISDVYEYHGPYEGVIAGGTSITFLLTEEYRAFINMTLWRLS